MRFVPIKSAEHQASGLNFRVRSLLVRQRAQMANSLRSQLAEFGVVVSGEGLSRVVDMAKQLLKDGEGPLPPIAHFAFAQLIEQIEATHARIAGLEQQILMEAKHSETVQRLMTIPGVGPMVAVAITSLAPSAQSFKSARHFAAWIGLTARNYSSGANQILGAVTKMGNRQIRTLLVMGAISVLKGIKPGDRRAPWVARLKQRRPYRVAAVALANKTARIIWALLIKGGTFKFPIDRPTGQ